MRNKKLCLLVCGNGAFAGAIMKYREDRTVIAVKWNPRLDIADLPKFARRRIVAVHVGRGREFPALLTYCEKRDIPIIQASTGQKRSSVKPKVAVIVAPNIGLSVIAFMKALSGFIDGLQSDPETKIVRRLLEESHHCQKKTVPGTARKLARALRIPAREIISTRDLIGQIRMGVPGRHLDRHAYHLITLGFMDGVHVELKIKVHGVAPYVSGVATIAYRLIVAKGAGKLKAGYQSVNKFVK